MQYFFIIILKLYELIINIYLYNIFQKLLSLSNCVIFLHWSSSRSVKIINLSCLLIYRILIYRVSIILSLEKVLVTI